MITEGYCRGSEESHDRRKYAKVTGMKLMSQEEFERELADIKESMNALMKLLEEQYEDQCYGWIMKKKKMKLPSLQRRLRQKVHARLKKELRTTEYKVFEKNLFLDEEETRNIGKNL